MTTLLSLSVCLSSHFQPVLLLFNLPLLLLRLLLRASSQLICVSLPCSDPSEYRLTIAGVDKSTLALTRVDTALHWHLTGRTGS